MRFFWSGLRKTSPPVKNSKTSKRIPKRVRPQRSYRGTGGPPGSHRYGHYTHAPGAAPDRRLEPPTAPPARRRGPSLYVRAPISEISKQSLDRPPPRSPHHLRASLTRLPPRPPPPHHPRPRARRSQLTGGALTFSQLTGAPDLRSRVTAFLVLFCAAMNSSWPLSDMRGGGGGACDCGGGSREARGQGVRAA